MNDYYDTDSHQLTLRETENVLYELGSERDPFNPKLKKYILPTFSREMYKWGSENWYKNHLLIWVSYEKQSSSHCVM